MANVCISAAISEGNPTTEEELMVYRAAMPPVQT